MARCLSLGVLVLLLSTSQWSCVMSDSSAVEGAGGCVADFLQASGIPVARARNYERRLSGIGIGPDQLRQRRFRGFVRQQISNPEDKKKLTDCFHSDNSSCGNKFRYCNGRGNCSGPSGRTGAPYYCNCDVHTTGPLCYPDPCIEADGTSSCYHGSVCRPTGVAPGFQCLCAEEYTGERCERRRSSCLHHACANGGSCRNQPGSDYTCVCPEGFLGDRCQFSAGNSDKASETLVRIEDKLRNASTGDGVELQHIAEQVSMVKANLLSNPTLDRVETLLSDAIALKRSGQAHIKSLISTVSAKVESNPLLSGVETTLNDAIEGESTNVAQVRSSTFPILSRESPALRLIHVISQYNRQVGRLLRFRPAPNQLMVFRTNGNWIQARFQCRSLGGQLATPRNAQENGLVRPLAAGVGLHGPRTQIWLGVNDIVTEGTFRAKPDLGLSYSNWARGEPNNSGGNQDCAAMRTDSFWDDRRCTTTSQIAGFACRF